MFDFKCSANCCVSASCCLGKCHTTQGTDITSISVGSRREKKMLAYSKFSHDVAERKKKKSWNIFKWLLIIQLGADWLPVMCWPLRVQSKSTGVSAPRGATVILGCGSSCPANVSRALLHTTPPAAPSPLVLKPHNMPNNCTVEERECAVCAYSITTPLLSHMD